MSGTLTIENVFWEGGKRIYAETLSQTFAGHMGTDGNKYFMMFDNAAATVTQTEEYPYYLASGKLYIRYYDKPFSKVK